ncbi:MAG: hydrogen peroxide-inducible genes activator [Xanthobacteraceae bacterium]|nr:hydrogen peroxide-inducible genes activator [Xanthobacteraceae bacterium]QYK45099.1 MAG: hydrogen peroxide-inducible genes activator [Xanthobacteraceae bacterium]
MNPATLSLRQLRYFEAAARLGHFGRAAEECAVTQPALSMQIRELEAALGAALFERRPGETVLTPLGREIAEGASKILLAANDLAALAKHRGKVLSGPLSLGIIPTLAPYILPQLLKYLSKQYPALKLELREAQTKAMLAELSRGELDLVMAAIPNDNFDLEESHLFDDRFLFAAGADDAKRARIDPETLDPAKLILLEEGHCLRDQALSFCAPERGVTKTGLGATSLSTVMQMVANGYGATFIPEIAVEAETRGRKLSLQRFTAPEPSRKIGLVWRKTSPRKRDFEAFGMAVKEALKPRRK